MNGLEDRLRCWIIFINAFFASDIEGKMAIFAWLIFATFMLLGFIFLSVMSVGVFVSLIVNLALLPLRVFIWILRLIFGIF
jgi:hypothetical protein